MTNDNKPNKKHKKFPKTTTPGLRRGDLIPMDEGQRQFLDDHNKFVNNPEMEAMMASLPTRGGRGSSKMSFGTAPLPWETQLTVRDYNHLNDALNRQYICRNKKDCNPDEALKSVTYAIVTHKKELPTEELDRERWGKREFVVNHVGVYCKACGKLVKYVKYNLTNRRAAKDLLVSGPHQKQTRG